MSEATAEWSPWGSFPRWVGNKLVDLTAGKDAGAHMAALRVYLAIALVANFKTREAPISWSSLQKLTGLSRPMVQVGISTAEAAGFLVIDKAGHTHSYRQLTQPSKEDHFTKVPQLRLQEALPDLPARGFHALEVLKVYMTLLTVRGRGSDIATISHKSIVKWSGIQPRRVRAALDVLALHRLIRVQSYGSEANHLLNGYRLLGFRNRQTEDSLEPVTPESDALAVQMPPATASATDDALF